MPMHDAFEEQSQMGLIFINCPTLAYFSVYNFDVVRCDLQFSNKHF